MPAVKMVIVCRKDLKCRKGKMMAQAAHAAVNAILNLGILDASTCTITIPMDSIYEWFNGLSTKICVGVNSEEELLLTANDAKAKGLPVAVVEDAGITEFHGVPTLTCIAIGPSKSELIDQITGHLELL